MIPSRAFNIIYIVPPRNHTRENNNDEMNKRVVNIIRKYMATQPVAKAWMFGSFARGEQTPLSDVDLIVSFKKDTKMGFRFAQMVCELEDLLHRNVDLVVDGNILPFAQDSVNHDKILIYEGTK